VLSTTSTKVTYCATSCTNLPAVRRPKPPLAAWLIRKRKEREWKPGDIASRLDVAEVTVRGWESGRNIRAESIESLERLFGEEAPGRGDAEGGAGSAATS
jgi:hypothetical protein